MKKSKLFFALIQRYSFIDTDDLYYVLFYLDRYSQRDNYKVPCRISQRMARISSGIFHARMVGIQENFSLQYMYFKAKTL